MNNLPLLRFKRKKISVTVCIAAIYNNNSILGASDRMVTGGYGDITFEPPTPKILNITNSIAVLTAGDQNIQMQVFQRVNKEVIKKIKEDPNRWIEVSEVADMYSKCFYELRNQLMEKTILSKYNLTPDSFVTKSRSMHQDLVNMIMTDIRRFEIEDIATIITGIDTSGPHIYVLFNGEISCNDKLGFASIGIGSNHATSHFMLSGYSRLASESKALLTIHQAKKKSEVSPGVGKETDMCVIGPNLGTFTMLIPLPDGRDVVKDLDNFYKKYTKAIDLLNTKTENNIQNYLTSITQQPTVTQEANPTLSTPSETEPTKSSKSKRKNLRISTLL